VTRPRIALLAIAATVIACTCWLFWHSRKKAPIAAPSNFAAAHDSVIVTPENDSTPTMVYAHNLLLRKGSDFRIYIRWIRGQMFRTRQQVNPSFDDPDSFILQIQKGVIRANIGDISNFLNATSPSDALSRTSRSSPKANNSNCTAPCIRSSLYPLNSSAHSPLPQTIA